MTLSKISRSGHCSSFSLNYTKYMLISSSRHLDKNSLHSRFIEPKATGKWSHQAWSHWANLPSKVTGKLAKIWLTIQNTLTHLSSISLTKLQMYYQKVSLKMTGSLYYTPVGNCNISKLSLTNSLPVPPKSSLAAPVLWLTSHFESHLQNK